MPTETTQPMQSRRPTARQRREAIRAACERRGVAIIPLEGGSYRLIGPGVDLRTTDLAFVEPREVKAEKQFTLGRS